MTIIEIEDGVLSEVGHQLKIVALAMGGGLTMMTGLIVWSSLHAAPTGPTPNELKSVNTLTTVMTVIALLSIVASEVVWRLILRKTPRALGARVQTAYIVRLAFREGAALLGMTVAYIAALSGVLRVYPAVLKLLRVCVLR